MHQQITFIDVTHNSIERLYILLLAPAFLPLFIALHEIIELIN